MAKYYLRTALGGVLREYLSAEDALLLYEAVDARFRVGGLRGGFTFRGVHEGPFGPLVLPFTISVDPLADAEVPGEVRERLDARTVTKPS
jgi:hypothetical protein